MNSNLTEEQIIDLMIQNEQMRQTIYEKNLEKAEKSQNEPKVQIITQRNFQPSKISIPILPVPSDYNY